MSVKYGLLAVITVVILALISGIFIPTVLSEGNAEDRDEYIDMETFTSEDISDVNLIFHLGDTQGSFGSFFVSAELEDVESGEQKEFTVGCNTDDEFDESYKTTEEIGGYEIDIWCADIDDEYDNEVDIRVDYPRYYDHGPAFNTALGPIGIVMIISVIFVPIAYLFRVKI